MEVATNNTANNTAAAPGQPDSTNPAPLRSKRRRQRPGSNGPHDNTSTPLDSQPIEGRRSIPSQVPNDTKSRPKNHPKRRPQGAAQPEVNEGSGPSGSGTSVTANGPQSSARQIARPQGQPWRTRQQKNDHSQVESTADNNISTSASSSVIIITGDGGDGGFPPRPPAASSQVNPNTGGKGRRGAKFNSGFTTSDASGNAAGKRPAQHRRPKPTNQNIPKGDDLTSTLIRGLSVAPFMDCAICFNAIHPAQPTWSCSPSIPVLINTSSDYTSSTTEAQYCWTTFHLKCIRSWAEKSFNEVKEAWRARGEPEKGGEWRCPGCQGKRITLMGGYR